MEQRFRSGCGYISENGGCPQFASSWTNLSSLYRHNRSLIIDHAYLGQGMGFMAFNAIDFIRLGMVVQRAVYFHFPVTPYDWTHYFQADHGRWGARRWSSTCVQLSRVNWDVLSATTECVVISWKGLQLGFGWVKELPTRDRAQVPLSTRKACTSCLMFAAFRPIWTAPAWRRLVDSIPSPPRRCLAIRTHYAEDPECFPDNTPLQAQVINRVYLQPNCSVWRRVSKRRGANGTVLDISAAVAQLGNEPILVVTDAPALQRYLIASYNHTVATQGTGIDPNSGATYRLKFKAGMQTVNPANLAKVGIDFWLMGFCECTLTLMPSQYYDAALSRTRHFVSRGSCRTRRGDW